MNLQSSPLLLWNLRPHRTAADHSALNLPRLRLTNRYSSPRRAINEIMRGGIQTTHGVDPRQLRRAPYGDLGSAASGFEPARRSRDIRHSFSPRRRTMSNLNLNSIRSPRQSTRRRSDVLRTRAPESHRSSRLPVRSRAPVRPMSGGPVRDISVRLKHVSLVVRKPVFGVSDQVRHKPGCTTTEDS